DVFVDPLRCPHTFGDLGSAFGGDEHFVADAGTGLPRVEVVEPSVPFEGHRHDHGHGDQPKRRPAASTSVVQGSAQIQGGGHRFHGDLRVDVGVDAAAAFHDRVDAAQGGFRGAGACHATQVGVAVRGGECHGRTELDGEHVPVEGDQVHEERVVGVPFDAGSAAFLPFLEFFEGSGCAAHCFGYAFAGGAFPESSFEVCFLLFVEGRGAFLRVGFRDLVQAGGGVHARAEAVEPGGDGEDFFPPGAGGFVGGELAGAFQVSGSGAGRGDCAVPVDPVPGDEGVDDRFRAGGAQVHEAAAGADRDEQVVGGGRGQQPRGARGGFFDCFEQGVGGGFGGAVGVFEQHDPEAAPRGAGGGAHHEFPGLLHAEAEPAGAHVEDVGVGSGKHLVAGGAFAAAAVGALEGGGECAGCLGSPCPGRAGEQPRVGHARAVTAGEQVVGCAHGGAQPLDYRVLAHQGVEDAHHRPA